MEPAALAALLSTVTAMLVRSRRRQTAKAARPSVSIRGGTAQILRLPTMPTAMLASIAVLSSIDILSAYLPVYAEEVGISVTAVSALLAVRAGRPWWCAS